MNNLTSEKLTFFELMEKIKSENKYPMAIQFENSIYKLDEYPNDNDYCEKDLACSYNSLLMHISETMTFQGLMNDKVFTLIERHEPESIWDLKDDDRYYYLSPIGDILTSVWKSSLYDKEQRILGNVYLSEEQAKNDAFRQRIEMHLLKNGGRRNFDKDNSNFTFVKGIGRKVEYIDSCNMHSGAIYFDSKEDIENALDDIGYDWLNEYLTGEYE